jgi:long-chain fatty acid transport protein
MLRFRLSAIALGLGCALALPAAQATNGYMSHAYSPASKGMAGAGEAAMPQDSMSVVGNPAGLARLGNRVDIGAAWFSPKREYKGVNPFLRDGAMAPIGSGDGTGTVESENNDFLIPNLGFSYKLDAASAVGVALFGNGGMNTDYRAHDTLAMPGVGNLGTYGGNNGCANPPHYPAAPGSRMPCGPQIPGTSIQGGGNTGVNLEQLGIAFGYSRNLLDNLTLGASFLLGYQTIEVRGVGAFQGYTQTFTQSFIANRGASASSPLSLTDQGEDSSWGYGFQVGALWDINPQWTLGLSLRSKMYMEEFDKYKDLFAGGGDFDMPAVGQIGLAYKPNDRLAIALDVQQIWYGQIDSIANENQLAQKCNMNAAFGPTQDGSVYDSSYCLGGSNGAGFGWRDMTIFKLGIQYAINDALTLRAGYSHGNQPVAGSQVAFNALAPAVIEDHWTLGATYKLRPNYELTFWGMYAPQETVKGPGAFTGPQAPEISMSQYELGVNFGWLF